MIPALSQSRYELMACDELYAISQIDGVKMPPSEPSERGSQIHHVMALYSEHCADNGVPSDWAKFDELCKAVVPGAGDILDGIRDRLVVDWEHFFAAELHLALWSDLTVTAAEPHYEGTLDALFLLDDNKAYIPDYKSHWRPFDADTFQSKLYPFLVMQHMPTVIEVTFELIFVRFKDARRSVTYTRDDLPALAKEIERARERQLEIHGRSKKFVTIDYFADTRMSIKKVSPRPPQEATPGAHCIYCPHLMKGTCPLGAVNPYGAMTLEERLKHVVQIDAARKHHLAIIKDYVEQSKGAVGFADGYQAAFTASEGGYYPLLPSVSMLAEWADANPEDKTIFDGLRVGSTQLKPKLKAKKRASLDQRMRDEVQVKETAVRFAIKKAGEDDDEEENS